MELTTPRKDGAVFLNHWDSLRGEDRIFILLKSGDAVESVYGDYGEHYEKPINLVLELRALAEKLGAV